MCLTLKCHKFNSVENTTFPLIFVSVLFRLPFLYFVFLFTFLLYQKVRWSVDILFSKLFFKVHNHLDESSSQNLLSKRCHTLYKVIKIIFEAPFSCVARNFVSAAVKYLLAKVYKNSSSCSLLTSCTHFSFQKYAFSACTIL